MTAQQKSRLLFVCNQNAVRSPMAEALVTARKGDAYQADSVGLTTGLLDGFSVAAMREIGIDITDHEPRSLADIDLAAYDRIITLTPAARDIVGARSRTLKATTDHWDVPDPSDWGDLEAAGREAILTRYRSVRDDIDRLIAARL